MSGSYRPFVRGMCIILVRSLINRFQTCIILVSPSDGLRYCNTLDCPPFFLLGMDHLCITFPVHPLSLPRLRSSFCCEDRLICRYLNWLSQGLPRSQSPLNHPRLQVSQPSLLSHIYLVPATARFPHPYDTQYKMRNKSFIGAYLEQWDTAIDTQYRKNTNEKV